MIFFKTFYLKEITAGKIKSQLPQKFEAAKLFSTLIIIRNEQQIIILE